MSAVLPFEVFSYILNVCVSDSDSGDDCEYGDRNQKSKLLNVALQTLGDCKELAGMERILLRSMIASGLEPTNYVFTLNRFVLRTLQLECRYSDAVILERFNYKSKSEYMLPINDWGNLDAGMMGIGLWDKLSRLFYIKNAMTGVSNTDFLYEPRVIEEVIFYSGGYARLKIYKIWGLA